MVSVEIFKHDTQDAEAVVAEMICFTTLDQSQALSSKLYG